MYKDDVKMALQSSGLYEWLLKVASVKGAVVGDDDAMGMEVGSEEGSDRRKDKGRSKDKEKEKDKKVLSGGFVYSATRLVLYILMKHPSDRCPRFGLYCQVSALLSPLSKNHSPLSTSLSLPPPFEAP